ncbi:Putative L-aminoadipate-semialdehyde dehydrogenase [Rhizopus microsporus]|nr:Putative L-aminoadipate-semialdehyde dehydrogenase [Rhizopus microsporus]
MYDVRPTPFSVILAAFSVLLQRYTGDEEFAIGTSSPTGNPLLLRLHVDPSNTFRGIIDMVTKVEQEALAQEVPFDQLCEAIYEGTDPDSRRPLCRVRFYNELDSPSQHHLATTSASSDLTIFISSPTASSSLRTSFLRIPKGVRGRHFSLTHFYPWMAETFGLSSQDKFTMLSGIAHDPIQRDIFTPLFLGAELHIPTSEDIGIPGRLAEWMNRAQVTVTHLTPAMGQLLSSHAQVEIPSLINAFFVGDILTKRDAARIQKYAPNVSVINMYGTTETQRSVSHFVVPPRSSHPAFLSSQKEVIAAGKGMVNVQLLVVNRHDRTKMCGVGEIGEIYVRAPGLAEGYLRLPEATAEKFIPNWFVPNACVDDGKDESTVKDDKWKQFYQGKRDRMYRSGDLGRYRPDGNVECTGRADDQVKIRGFRIELGEIDTHLSQHPFVRENVTLVRRDKNEEQTLIYCNRKLMWKFAELL